MTTLRPLEEQLTDLLRDYQSRELIVGGAQVTVIHQGQVAAQVAYGTDSWERPMRTDTVSCCYCVSKIPLFLAFLAAIDAGQVGLESTIAEVLPDASPFVGAATILETLSQRGGFSTLQGPLSRFIPAEDRRLAHRWLPESAKLPRGLQAYSVSEVGWLTALMLERLTGKHYADAVTEVLIGLFGPQILPPQTGPLSVTFQPSDDGATVVPLLNEATRALRSQWNPSLGWYTTATGIALVGAAINDAWHGRTKLSQDLVRYATSPVAPATMDAGLDREASFGLGFWTELSKTAYGPAISGTAFGHNAQGGTSYLVVDPERELVVAGGFDLAYYGDAETGVRRRPLIETIVAGLDA